MKIIRKPDYNCYKDITFYAECSMCGGAFEVTFPVAHMKDGSAVWKNTENLVALTNDAGTFRCLCPLCLARNVELEEKP